MNDSKHANANQASGNRILLPNRRLFLNVAATGAAAAGIATVGMGATFYRPGRFAEELTPTAKMTVGPFFPDKMPLDTDNDLLILSDSLTPAVGEIVHLSGRVLSRAGQPMRNLLIEIWQVDNQGSYIHSDGASPQGRDKNFQGYGRFLTDVRGRYYFRTVKPVAYNIGKMSRAPHIHFQIRRGDKALLASQLMIEGEPANDEDDVLTDIRDPELKATIMAKFEPLPGSKIGELQVNFDVVLGRTLEELEDGTLGLRSKEKK